MNQNEYQSFKLQTLVKVIIDFILFL